MLEHLVESLENSRVIMKGSYPYFIHPVTDGIPQLEPQLLEEICSAMEKVADTRCDKIVAIEAMGIHLAAALCLRLKKPLNIIRKRRYELPGEFFVHVSTGYSENTLFVNGLNRGDRILLVDDVISTGGTLGGVIRTLEDHGILFSDIVVVIAKENSSDTRKALDARGIKYLARIKVENQRIRVLEHV